MDALRVLLVDDEEDLVDTMVERLNLRGLKAQGAYHGNMALERLAESDFDVVVVDLKMPGMSGEDLLRRVKAKHPDIRVILITGHGAIRADEEAAEAGTQEYLVKPFDIEALIRVMKRSVSSE